MTRSAWQSLQTEFNRFENIHMRDLFNQDNERASKYTKKAANFTLDYSKNRIDDAILDALFTLAKESQVEQKKGCNVCR
jgi:glucose-6-phosphate isomerase